MSKHTPGPWSLVNGYNIFSELGADSGDGYKAPENDGWLIATVELGSVFNDDGDIVELGHGVARANARLIAEAPELLSLLKEARRYLVSPSLLLYYDIDRVIARVTGEER